MFEDLFEKIHQALPEVKMIGIWGKDGLELDKKIYSRMQIDLELLGAEIADIITRMDKIRITYSDLRIELASQSIRIGIFSLSPRYFLFILGEENCFWGKCRFYFDLFAGDIKASL